MELLISTLKKILAGEPNAVLFFSAAALFVGYIVYMMIRRPRDQRAGAPRGELDL